MHVLVLGGTALARQVADLIDGAGLQLSYSLAGRTSRPEQTPGRIVSGGFGGTEGLAQWLTTEGVDAVIDATHSFAATMTKNAFEACSAADVPLLRLESRSWADRDPGWLWTKDHAEAAQLAAGSADGIFLTVGRQPLRHYLEPLADRVVLTRMVEPPDEPLPSSWQLLLARGPFKLADEIALMTRPPALGCVVTKDAGGDELDAKLLAAAQVGATVVMVARPPAPGPLEVVNQPSAALHWLRAISPLNDH